MAQSGSVPIRELARNCFNQARAGWEQGDVSGLDEVYSDDLVYHMLPFPDLDKVGLRNYITGFLRPASRPLLGKAQWGTINQELNRQLAAGVAAIAAVAAFVVGRTGSQLAYAAKWTVLAAAYGGVVWLILEGPIDFGDDRQDAALLGVVSVGSLLIVASMLTDVLARFFETFISGLAYLENSDALSCNMDNLDANGTLVDQNCVVESAWPDYLILLGVELHPHSPRLMSPPTLNLSRLI